MVIHTYGMLYIMFSPILTWKSAEISQMYISTGEKSTDIEIHLYIFPWVNVLHTLIKTLQIFFFFFIYIYI